MRRNYISPEFDYSRVYGSFNMIEETNFFASKMLRIDSSILMDNQNLVYFQSLTNEQINLSIESHLPSISFSSSDDRRLNSTLIIDPTQTISQKNTNTSYILTINLKQILTDYIFATLKRYRTFEGVRNTMTQNNDVNFAITDYITRNVLNRYQLSDIQLYLNYVNISNLSNQNALMFDNIWAGYTDPITNRTAISPDIIGTQKYQVTKFQTKTSFDYSSTIVTFNQMQSSSDYCFDYYFKLTFNII